MDEKIKKIQQEIENLYLQGEGDEQRRELLRGFWEQHVVPVIDLSKEMARKYDAQEHVVWAGALFHDFALLSGGEPHDELGAILAKDYLLERGFEEEFCQQVSDVVLTHRCRIYPPQTLEQKIVATADAVSHFLPSFYLGIMPISSDDYKHMKSRGVDKLESDFEQKIFFEDEKKMLRERIEDFRKWFVYKTE